MKLSVSMRIGRSTRGEPQQSREGNGLRADEDITLAGFFARSCLMLAGRNLPQGADHAGGRHISWRTLDRKTPTVTWKDHSTFSNFCSERRLGGCGRPG